MTDDTNDVSYEFRTYIDTPDAGPVRMGSCRKCGALVEMDFASRDKSTLHTEWHKAEFTRMWEAMRRFEAMSPGRAR